MNLGEKLYELRKTKNLTQDDLAEKLNVTRQTISKWETNQSTPDFDKIVPLCELYGITPNDLLIEKQEVEDAKETEKSNLDEVKAHLFTRGKDDEKDYENMTRNQIKQETAKVVSTSVFIYIASISLLMILTPVKGVNPVVASAVFLLLVGWATVRMIKHYMSIPKYEKTKEEKKQKKIIEQINGIIGLICVVIYFIVSFTTFAWHITWVIFIIYTLLRQVVKLVFILKGDEENEE